MWIDQDLCTGNGLCAEIAPDVFVLLDDGMSYVQEGGRVMAASAGNPQGHEGAAAVAAADTDRVVAAPVEAAEECPGECIFVGG